jgi:beta-lysine 5,6-aminomutase alpha subunit
MLTEAIHTPFMSDRYLSIENAKYIFNNLRDISDEIEFKKNGIIQKRAHQVLDESIDLLEKMSKDGLFNSLTKGIFANIKRPLDGGKGLEGVFDKGKHYFNPFITKMLEGN